MKAFHLLLLTSTIKGAPSDLINSNWPRYQAYGSNTGLNANTMHNIGYACIRNNWIYNFP